MAKNGRAASGKPAGSPGDDSGAAKETVEQREAKFFSDNVAYSIIVLANVIARYTSQHTLRGLDLNVNDWRLLRLAKIFGPISAAEIIATIAMDKTTVSRAITKAHERKLIKLAPNPSDRRQTFVMLTAAGAKLLERHGTLDEQFDRSFEMQLSEEEQESFHRIMGKLRGHAHEMLKNLPNGKPASRKRQV